MNDQNRRVSVLATRMRGFAATHEADFPSDSVGGQRFTLLNELVTKIDQFGSKQAQEKGSAKAFTEAKKALRDDIRRQMRAIRETALSIEAQQPGISQNFNMPTSSSDESLVEAARAFVAAATPLKPLFLSREMPEDFLEVLTDAIQSFEEAVSKHNLHRGNRSAARTLLDDVCSQVIELRRELDPIVRNKYRNDPEKRALWETASHLEKPSRRSAPTEPEGTNQSPAGGQT
jgi:hypothetical protein